AAEPRIVVSAWGLQGTSLGSCTEITPSACDGFNEFALALVANARAGQPLPTPLPNASYAIPLLDPDDRDVGVVDATGAETTRTRNEAGLVTTEDLPGTPIVHVANVYDLMGRVLSTTRGSGNERLQ